MWRAYPELSKDKRGRSRIGGENVRVKLNLFRGNLFLVFFF